MNKSLNVYANQCFANVTITGKRELTFKPIDLPADYRVDPLVDWNEYILPLKRGFFKERVVDTGLDVTGIFHQPDKTFCITLEGEFGTILMFSKFGQPWVFEDPISIADSPSRSVHKTLNGLVVIDLRNNITYYHLTGRPRYPKYSVIGEVVDGVEIIAHPYRKEWFALFGSAQLLWLFSDEFHLGCEDVSGVSLAELHMEKPFDYTTDPFNWRGIYGMSNAVMPQLVLL